MNKEIEQFIINNYKELRTFCISLTKHNDWAEDLLQDVLLQLYEKDNIKIEKLDNKSIKNYIFRCIITNWYSETSPFYRKIRRESSLYNELTDIPNDIPMEEYDGKEDKVMTFIEEEFSSLNWFHKDIFSRYLVLGSYKSVSTQTKIPITSIGNYIREAKETVKLNVFKRIKED